MNKNEWIKKYLKDYNEVRGTNKSEGDLTDREKAVADALYERYKKERLSEQEKEISNIERQLEVEKALKEGDNKAEMIKNGIKEDSLLRGKNGLDAKKSVETKVDNLKESEKSTISNEKEKSIEREESELSATLRKYKEDTEKKLDGINSKYDKIESDAYDKTVKAFEEIKASRWVKNFIYQKGTKDEMIKYLEEHKGEVGEKYDELMSIINQTEEFDREIEPVKEVKLKLGGSTVTMSEKEYSLVNAVKYKKNAGSRVTFGDNFVVTYEGFDYKIQGGNKVEDSLNSMLLELAKNKQKNLKVGDVFYYNNHLYVYAEADTMRECKNRGKSVSTDSLDSLLKALFAEKEKTEVETDYEE